MTREDRTHHLIKLLLRHDAVAKAKAEIEKAGKHALTFRMEKKGEKK